MLAPKIKKLKWNLYVVGWSSLFGHSLKKTYFRSSVRLGEYDISTVEDCFRGKCTDPPVDITIDQTIPHEKYVPTSRNQENDIALIRLSRPVKYTSKLSIFCER